MPADTLPIPVLIALAVFAAVEVEVLGHLFDPRRSAQSGAVAGDAVDSWRPGDPESQPMDEPVKRVHVYISGIVQGVSFRYYTLQEAMRSGATGWVRNMPDGRVEAVIEGDESVVERMLAWCGEGPRGGHVDHVEVLPETATGEFQGFRVR